MLQESAVKLWREMQNVTSPLQPYLRVLPDRPHVSSFYDIPVSYLPLIQNAAMVGGCSSAVHVVHVVRVQCECLSIAASKGTQMPMT